MAAVALTPDDLAPFAEITTAKAEAMIEDVMAMAVRVAPCIAEESLSPQDAAAAKAVLRGAVLRWNDSGSGALQTQQESVDDYSRNQTVDTRQPRRGLFWPSEIEQLQDICKGDEVSGAFSVDTVGVVGAVHADICALNFGALYCSCGASLTLGWPLYEWTP